MEWRFCKEKIYGTVFRPLPLIPSQPHRRRDHLLHDLIDCKTAQFRASKSARISPRDEISVNQFIAAAVSEKMASVITLDYLKSEAAKGSHSDFDRFLNLVPDTPATAGDELHKN